MCRTVNFNRYEWKSDVALHRRNETLMNDCHLRYRIVQPYLRTWPQLIFGERGIVNADSPARAPFGPTLPWSGYARGQVRDALPPAAGATRTDFKRVARMRLRDS